jgi:hypothetical protein
MPHSRFRIQPLRPVRGDAAGLFLFLRHAQHPPRALAPAAQTIGAHAASALSSYIA